MSKKKKEEKVLTPEEERAKELARRREEALLAAIRSDRPEPKKRGFLRPIVIVVAVLCAIMVFFLATFGFVGNTWFARAELQDSKFETSTYTEEEKQAAADAVIDYFRSEFNGSVLYELDYSEKWSRKNEAICFTGRFYTIFSNNEIVDNTSYVRGSKWHWDVRDVDGAYTVVSYGELKDTVDVTGGDTAEQAE